ncbi:MAG: peptidoglycan-binding protein [Eubacteriales bacterium]|nr:peptidoglycan-binding protein [Eubacteriales bacterium]
MKKKLLLVLSVMLVLLSFPATAFATQRYEILKIGDEDEFVEDLQNKLKALGYFDHSVTGYFGTVTQQAVIDYQADHSLTVDGKAGPETLKSIFGEDYEISTDRFVEGNESTDTCYPGDKGDAVSDIQERLKKLEYYDYSSITGYYGPVTYAAVQRFQRTNTLTVDGVAGPETQTLLFSDDAKYFCIYPGDSGDDVISLQTRLCELGYYTYNNITGYFGTVTEEALKEFQAQNGLTADAKAGKNTRALLYSSDAPEWDGVDRIDTSTESDDSTSETTIEKMLSFAQEQLDKKYVYSTEGPTTFDCSGFVYYVLKYMGVSTARYSASGFSTVDSWEKIDDQGSLEPGDLLFFQSDGSTRISHTGIYLGAGEFIHASASGGCVKISSMTSYYDRNFVFARRVFS